MEYQIIIENAALKFLRKLDRRQRDELQNAIDALATEPRPFGYKKMVDAGGLYRIKAGDYRIIYFVRDRQLIVTVVRIAKRNERTY